MKTTFSVTAAVVLGVLLLWLASRSFGVRRDQGPQLAQPEAPALSTEEHFRDLGVRTDRVALVSLAFSNLCSTPRLEDAKKRPGNYRLQFRELTNGLSVHFIPRKGPDEEYLYGGGTSFGIEVEFLMGKGSGGIIERKNYY